MISQKWWVLVILSAFNLKAVGEDALQQASRLVDAGTNREAKIVLLKLLKQDPQNPKAHELLGDVYRHEGNGKGADKEYRLALDLGIQDAGLLNSLATVQKWTRHYFEARTTYRRELELGPSDPGASSELRDLNYKRGLSLFASYGSPETDSTTKGWQGELFYGGLDRIDPYAGASYSDKFFYTRQSYYAKAYAFLTSSFYIKFNFEQDNYNYPVAVTPVPDANAYRHVPNAGIEVSKNFNQHLRGTISYQFFRPNFFFDQGEHANNQKLSGDIQYQTAWKPLNLSMQAATLRDPDPSRTTVDKSNHIVVPIYGLQFLAGGGADFTFPRFDAHLLMLPNRDLDRSTDYSVLTALNVPLGRTLRLRNGYVFDHYSSQSVFSGQSAHIYNVGFSWKTARWLELTFGGKVVRRPIRNDQAVYVATSIRLPIR